MEGMGSHFFGGGDGQKFLGDIYPPSQGIRTTDPHLFSKIPIESSVLNLVDSENFMKNIAKCKSLRLLSKRDLRKNANRDMATFMVFGTKVVNLGPIDFLLDFTLNINVNDGENKFEVHISKHMAKIANL